MLQLRYQGTVRTGNDALDFAISDVLVVSSPSGPVLVTVTGGTGGVVSYRLGEGDLPRVVTWRGTVDQTTTATGSSLIETDAGLIITGQRYNGVQQVNLSGTGGLSGLSSLTVQNSGEAAVGTAVAGTSLIALADTSDAGFSLYAPQGNSRFNEVRDIRDFSITYADAIGAMDSAVVNGRSYVAVASTSEYGVSLYQVQGTNAIHLDGIGPADGLGIMVPTDVQIVSSGGRDFLIVASAAGGGGGAGALSVLEIGAGGTLTPTDHVMDTRDSRFGTVQTLATAQYGEIVLVAAGGGDDGVSLLALLPDGRLVALDHFADTLEAGLSGVNALEMVVIGDELQVIAASDEDAGVTILSANLSGLGSVVQASGDANQAIVGTIGHDILSDGAGRDTLIGGGGADVFLIGADGQTDTISDFNPAQDRLDLSSWPLLYDVSAISILQTATGARLSYRGEVLSLRGPGNSSLDPEAVRAAIRIDVNRSFAPPSETIIGNGTSERIDGTWGLDTLNGGGGNDTLNGGQGDDSILGGSGSDVAEFGVASDTVDVLGIEGDRVTISSGDGLDVIEGVESFRFSDTTLSFAQLTSLLAPTVLTGGAGDDTLTETSLPATLQGLGGSDLLTSGGGDDTLEGGEGNDTLSAGGGQDLLEGGSGNDSLRGADGNDVLIGGTGRDTLDGGAGADRLDGEDGNDLLFGRDGNDRLTGGANEDRLLGGLGNDTLDGGSGRDTLAGETGNDRLTGGADADLLNGGDGLDTLDGGTGRDTLLGEAGNDRLTGGTDADSLVGGDGEDTLDGGSGNDTLSGGQGNDRLAGGSGDDLINAGTGTDTVVISASSSSVRVTGISGDRVTLSSSQGNDVLIGVERFEFTDDTFVFAELEELTGPTLVTGSNSSDVLRFESGDAYLIGMDGSDDLTTGNGFDQIEAGAGDDTVDAGRGNDTIDAGSGNDAVWGFGGDDTIYGQDGDDILRGGRENDLIFGGSGDDTLLGQRNIDRLYGGSGSDIVNGGGGPDTLFGDSGNDWMRGGTFADLIYGGSGNDTIEANRHDDTVDGGSGNDRINTGGDDDRLIGGSGDDWMRGGTGADTFVFDRGHDRDEIDDFDRRYDRLELSSELLAGRSVAQILEDARVTRDGLLLDFGGGDTILLSGLSSTRGLEDQIDIF